MDFDSYQEKAREYVAYEPHVAVQYLTAALAEETGEALGVIAKTVRKEGTTTLTIQEWDKLGDELGDVLWNLAMLADVYGISLQGVAHCNLDKLEKRKENDTIVQR